MKETQKQLLVKMMQDDEKDGIYDVVRLKSFQDVLDATTPENLDGFLEDFKMCLMVGHASRMEYPEVKLNYIDWCDDGKRIVATELPGGDLIGVKQTERSNWISVEDRLPEDEGGRYWCYVAEQNDLGLSHYQWNYPYSKQDGWGNDDGATVTHWQPLPSPPPPKKEA